ncbi:hypothetical protein SAMN05444411_104181 [Lutibacter oricola]|uniref:CarboxypepD_reg-like domain-containing protein n=1 Tax=Lutibacter oricola TaxID=762486 RepID=A0A1H3AN67_9FLAO|nr:hypothetical protein [Lutibacter oricola]SDX31180.1 hypothetical protein SAMN05444411_104181 [Lutibacter oricola]
MKTSYYYNAILLILVFIIHQNLNAQENLIRLNGIVKNDSLLLKDINIINKTKKTGASSNAKGEFIIHAALGDSILFSSLSYVRRTIKISNYHIKHKKMVVYLEQGYNELDEITLNQRIKFDTSKILTYKGMPLDRDDDFYREPPNIRKSIDPTANAPGGNILGLVFKLADVLFLNKIREKKKEKRKKLKIKTEKQTQFLDNIVTNYSEEFFTKELKIHPDKIYIFIDYCQDNNLKKHYNANEFVVKNFLITQSKKFNQIKP